VLLVMKEGDRLDEHSAPGPITLSVHEGRIRFSAADKSVEAEAGTVLACDAGGATRSRLSVRPSAF
jgi:quercetin dioxygenase-like cupin family protein